MIELDLEKYASDYHDIYKIGRNHIINQIDDDSSFKIYEAQKNNYGKVFLKVIKKEAFMELIQKEKEISYLCNSEYTLNLIRDYETKKKYYF